MNGETKSGSNKKKTHLSTQHNVTFGALTVPDWYFCPLSGHDHMMVDPVKAGDGQIYEREAIVAHFRDCRRFGTAVYSPVTSERLLSLSLQPEVLIKHHIDMFKKKYLLKQTDVFLKLVPSNDKVRLRSFMTLNHNTKVAEKWGREAQVDAAMRGVFVENDIASHVLQQNTIGGAGGTRRRLGDDDEDIRSPFSSLLYPVRVHVHVALAGVSAALLLPSGVLSLLVVGGVAIRRAMIRNES